MIEYTFRKRIQNKKFIVQFEKLNFFSFYNNKLVKIQISSSLYNKKTS